MRPMTPDSSPAGGILASARAHAKLVVAVAVLTALVALAWHATRTPSYEASATVLVTPVPDGAPYQPGLPLLRVSSDKTRLVETAASVVDSPAAAALAARRLGPGWTGRLVQSVVDVKPVGGSDVVSVAGRSDSPKTAARIANEFARASLDQRSAFVRARARTLTGQTERQLRAETDQGSALATTLAERLADLRALREGDPTLSINGVAESPRAASGPSSKLLLVAALLFGLAVGVGLALLRDMVGPRRILDAEEAVATAGIPPLARVPRLPLADRLRRPPRTRFRPRAASAFRALQRQLDLEPGRVATVGLGTAVGSRGSARGRTVMLVGGSAGDGVTTSVAEFGLTGARADHHVLLVDLDPAAQLAPRLGVTARRSLSEALRAGTDWSEAVQTVPDVGNLRLLTVGGQGSMGISDDVARELPRTLVEATAQFDYVVIDARPLSESADVLGLTSVVDSAVLVLRPGNTTRLDLETSLDLLERAGMRPQGSLIVSGRAPATPSEGPPSEPRPPRRAPATPSEGPPSEPRPRASTTPTRPATAPTGSESLT
jgi:Mrp family chromosome partitioning ATPase/capsular polysaccharide biosynthesis protein